MAQAVVRKLTPPALEDGSNTNLVVDAFGSLAIQDLVEKWKREGRVYFYNRGNTTTPVTGTNTAILYTRPSLVVRVPTGKTIIPIYLGQHIENAAGTDNEAVWIACSNDIGAGTSTAVAAGTNRGNMRSDLAGNGGSCLINITYTGDVTTTGTNPVEFVRWQQSFVDAIGATPVNNWIVDIKHNSNMPVLVGPASLIYIIGGSTALDTYTTVMWAEFNSSEIGL
jgi:hypothetical protein